MDTAADIAKESSDVILLEKELTVLIDGVIRGRRTFGNIVKYVKMAASGNFGNASSLLGAVVFLPFLPILPVQLLAQNVLYDASQVSIPWDNMDEDFLREPRKWETTGVRHFMLILGPVSSIFDYALFAPMAYFPWLLAILVCYAVTIEVVKKWYVRRFNEWL